MWAPFSSETIEIERSQSSNLYEWNWSVCDNKGITVKYWFDVWFCDNAPVFTKHKRIWPLQQNFAFVQLKEFHGLRLILYGQQIV